MYILRRSKAIIQSEVYHRTLVECVARTSIGATRMLMIQSIIFFLASFANVYGEMIDRLSSISLEDMYCLQATKQIHKQVPACDQGPYLIDRLQHHYTEGIGQSMMEMNLPLRIALFYNLSYLPTMYSRSMEYQSLFCDPYHRTNFNSFLGFTDEISNCFDDVALNSSHLKVVHIRMPESDEFLRECEKEFMDLCEARSLIPSSDATSTKGSVFNQFKTAIEEQNGNPNIVYILNRRYRDCRTYYKVGYWLTDEIYGEHFWKKREKDLDQNIPRFLNHYHDVDLVVAYHFRAGDLAPSDVSTVTDYRTLPYQNATTILKRIFFDSKSLLKKYNIKWKLQIFTEDIDLSVMIAYIKKELREDLIVQIFDEGDPYHDLDGLAVADIMIGASSGFTGFAAALNKNGITLQPTFTRTNLQRPDDLYDGRLDELNERVCRLKRLEPQTSGWSECIDRN